MLDVYRKHSRKIFIEIIKLLQVVESTLLSLRLFFSNLGENTFVLKLQSNSNFRQENCQNISGFQVFDKKKHHMKWFPNVFWLNNYFNFKGLL